MKVMNNKDNKIRKRWKTKISVYDITNKILLPDSNYIVDVVMWPKFGSSSISMREVIITCVIRFLPQKPIFWRVLGFLVQIWWFGTGTNYGLETLHQSGKRVKTKI